MAWHYECWAFFSFVGAAHESYELDGKAVVGAGVAAMGQTQHDRSKAFAKSGVNFPRSTRTRGQGADNPVATHWKPSGFFWSASPNFWGHSCGNPVLVATQWLHGLCKQKGQPSRVGLSA